MIKEVRIKFDEFLHDTGKAILVCIGGDEFWLPKNCCRNLIINKKLGGNVCLPVSLCHRKGISFDDSDATFTITTHVPEKIEAKKIEPPKELRR